MKSQWTAPQRTGLQLMQKFYKGQQEPSTTKMDLDDNQALLHGQVYSWIRTLGNINDATKTNYG